MVATLRPMPTDALAAWIEHQSVEYVRERMGEGDSAEYAEERAAESNAQYFPHGVPAEGQHVYEVVHGSEVVGALWIGPISPRHPHDWWVFDIEIEAAHRGKGFGRAAMQLAETQARAHGAVKLGLNVFGHNTVAQGLYTSLGYEITAINMAKSL